MEEKRPEVRIYQPGKDDERVVALFNLVFEEKISPALWRHKYAENPAGGWAFLTFVGEELVSVAGWLVRRFLLDGDVFPVASMGDVMVHPAWRGRFGGRLGSMARPLWEEIFNQAGIIFGLGFPNPKHYLVGKRFVRAQDMGNFEVGIEVFSRLWRLPTLAEIMRRLRALAQKSPALFPEMIPLSNTDHNGFKKKLEKIWEKTKSDLKVCFIKDYLYLNWRYFTWEKLSPEKTRAFFLLHRGKEPVAFLILRRVFIGPIKGFELEEIVCPQEEAPVALETTKVLTLKAGGHFLRYLISPALGFRAKRVERKAPALWRPFAYRGKLSLLQKKIAPERWHLSLGDIAL